MKIITIIILSFLIQNICAADDWDIVKQFEKSHFVSVADSTIHSIDFIREYDTGDGIEYYNYYFNEITKGTILNPLCIIEQGDGWLGRKVVLKSDGSQFFQNSKNELIEIKVNANQGDTWRLMRLKYGNYVEAELETITYKNIFTDVYDSVKIMKLTEKDNQDNIVDSPINNLQFELSKHYGMISLFNIYFFPDSLLPYKLIGIESIGGVKPITFREVFDFEIDDEFHIYEGDTSSSNSGILRWRRIKITDKTFYPEKNIIDYEAENKVMQVRFILNEYDTVYNDNYVHIRYDLNNYTDYLPEQSYLNISNTDTLLTSNYFFTGEYGGRQVIRPWKIYERNIPPCFTKTHRLYYKNYSYIEGCGDFFENNYGYGYTWKRLVYYKKNGKEWGTPLDFVVSVNENQKQTEIKLLNEILEGNEDLHVFVPSSGKYEYSMSTLSGRLIISKPVILNEGINSLKVHDLAAGIYFITLQIGDKIFFGKFAVVK